VTGGANRSPLSCCDSGRVHPNPIFQQAYAFTQLRFDLRWVTVQPGDLIKLLLAAAAPIGLAASETWAHSTRTFALAWPRTRRRYHPAP